MFAIRNRVFLTPWVYGQKKRQKAINQSDTRRSMKEMAKPKVAGSARQVGTSPSVRSEVLVVEHDAQK